MEHLLLETARKLAANNKTLAKSKLQITCLCYACVSNNAVSQPLFATPTPYIDACDIKIAYKLLR